MRFTVLLLLFTVLISSCSTEADTAGELLEIRGVWITNVDSEVMFSRTNSEVAINYLAERGFNVIFPVVWNAGYTLYPSDVMAEYFGEEFRVHPDFDEPGRDALQDLIELAREHDIEVIPWFEYGFASSHNLGGGHILEAYPHWAAKDAEGNLLTKNGFEWMNAFHYEVQEFMLKLIAEVIENYDIDGIQGDDRLPALPAEGGYSDYTRELYRSEFGVDPPANHLEEPFLQWKADRLTNFGEELFEMVKAYDRDLIVSFSPSPYDWSKYEYLQDWPEWIRRGIVDIIHPQVYRYEIDAYTATLLETQDHFLQAMEERELREGRDQPIFHAPGILIKVGERYNGPEYVNQALRLHRDLGIDGEVYFFYEGLHENNEYLGDAIFESIYHEPARLPYRE